MLEKLRDSVDYFRLDEIFDIKSLLCFFVLLLRSLVAAVVMAPLYWGQYYDTSIYWPSFARLSLILDIALVVFLAEAS